MRRGRSRGSGFDWSAVSRGDREATPFITAFQQRLQQLGWAADRNIRFEHRFGANDTARYRTYAAELVGLAPDVIVATNTPTLQALQQRSQTVPIVFYRVSDPVGDGFIKSLAHPGGNITGFANQDFFIAGKWLQLLKDVAPNAHLIFPGPIDRRQAVAFRESGDERAIGGGYGAGQYDKTTCRLRTKSPSARSIPAASITGAGVIRIPIAGAVLSMVPK